jgi:THO complex subunit 1
MPASKGKALPLLRTINAFLRFLPRTPADLVFRGRVHQFASSVISVADKSAINMRGDYNDLKTAWEGEDMKENETMEDGADVKMEEAMKEESKDGVMPADKSKDGVPEPSTPQSNFYSTLWSLQQYFAFPPSLDGPPMGDPPRTPFQDFKTKSDFVLPKVFEQTQKEKELLGTDTEVLGSKRKRAADDGGFFHPRYLTGKRLLEHEVCIP